MTCRSSASHRRRLWTPRGYGIFVVLLLLGVVAIGPIHAWAQTKPVVTAKDRAGRPTDTTEIDGNGDRITHHFTYDKAGKVATDEKTVYRPGTNDPNQPSSKQKRTYDPKTGGIVEQVDEVYEFNASGDMTGGRRITNKYDADGKPIGDPKSEKLKKDGTWENVSYEFEGPSLVAAGDVFTGEVIERTPEGDKPLEEGDLATFSGKVVPVGKGGKVTVPGSEFPRGLIELRIGVCIGGDPETPVGECRHHVVELPRTPEAKCGIGSGSTVLRPGQPIHVTGAGLGELKNPMLEGTEGRQIKLREIGGSPYEKVYATDSVIAAKSETFHFVGTDSKGNRVECPGTIKRPDLKIDAPALRLVGQKGDITLTSDVDCVVDIVGGEGYIQLARRTVELKAGRTEKAPFVAKRVGRYDLEFPIHSPDEMVENPDAPPAHVKTDPPTANYDPGSDKTHVKLPLELKDGAGKPIENAPVHGICCHPGGVDDGHCKTDKRGHGFLEFDLIGKIDLANIVAEVANAAGHNLQQAAAHDDPCCIKKIILTNDDDGDVYYAVYTPGTKTAKRKELAHTEKVTPGGSIVLVGDFGHCVRIAALRRPVPYEGERGVTGLISDREFCCGKIGKEEVDTRNEGMRHVIIESGPCADEKQPEPPKPPVLPVPTTPPVEPPKPPVTPPTVYYPPKDGLKIGLGWKYNWDPTFTPYTPEHPPVTVTINNPDQITKADWYDGYFEPVQSVFQDDEKFSDFETKQITKLAPASYKAELDMVVDKPTLIFGLRNGLHGSESHDIIRIYGTTHAAIQVPVKWRFTLKQGGSSKVVYEEPGPSNSIYLYGSSTQEHPIDVASYPFNGFPAEDDSWKPFKFAPGGYELVGELITFDDKPTGYSVSVVGKAVETQAPPFYLVPLGVQHHAETSPAAALNRANSCVPRAVNLQSDLAFWGPTFLPVREQGLAVYVVPPMLAVLPPLKKGGWLSSDEVADRVVDQGRIMSMLPITLSLWSMLGGQGKVIGLVDPYDFDLTTVSSLDAAAFTISEKSVLMDKNYNFATVAMHEMTHAEPWAWSDRRMQNLFGFSYHNSLNHGDGNGVRIYPNSRFRRRHYFPTGLMGSVPSTNDLWDKWIEQGTYWWLLKRFQGVPDPDILVVSGVVDTRGGKTSVEFTPFYTTKGNLDEGSVDGAWEIVTRSSSGRELGRLRFDGNIKQMNGMMPFAQRVPMSDDLASVELVGPHGVIGKQDLSSAAPTLSVALTGVSGAPAAGEKFTVSWKASCSNGETPLATVLYSPDGEAWFPAASYTTASSAEVTMFGFVTKPMVKVVVSDWTRSREVVLDVKPSPAGK